MKIILLDKIPNLGDIADIVEVNSGYTRNFLTKKKAMFASKNNLEYVAERKAELAEASADEVSRAEAKAAQLKDQSVEIKVPVTDEGALYGSVDEGFQMHLLRKILRLIRVMCNFLMGLSKRSAIIRSIFFHPEVSTEITVIVKPE